MLTLSDDLRLAARQRPPGRPVMHQSWRELLFLHWRVEPEVMQTLLPDGLQVDTFDGSAWIGVVPFLMRRIRPVGWPSVPYLSNFLELNLRTYAVNGNGVPGVWFISLNADRLLAVNGARWKFHLPYYWCRMSARRDSRGWIDYSCQRLFTADQQPCQFRYRGVGTTRLAQPGTLEFFLTERYVLFARNPKGRLFTGRVHHPPYPLQEAEVTLYDQHLMRIDGVSVPERPFDHACYVAGVDVDVFGLEACDNGQLSA